MSYQLPTNMSGDVAIKSVCVHYPDYPEFKSALLGALLFFTKWTAWERDSEHNASMAAHLWSMAHDETVKTWDDVCANCDDEMNCDEIRDIISEELAKMTIYNNIYNGCGCGCGGASGGLTGTGNGVDTQPPDDYVPPVDEPIVQPPEPEYTPDFAQYKCDAAYYLHYKFRQEFLELQNLWDIGEFEFERVGGVIDSAVGWVGALALWTWERYYVLVGSFTDFLAHDTTKELTLAWDGIQQELVCEMVNADGVNEVRDAFRAKIDGLPVSWWGRYYLSLLEQSIDYASIFYPEDYTEIVIDPSFQNRDCSACGQEPSVLLSTWYYAGTGTSGLDGGYDNDCGAGSKTTVTERENTAGSFDAAVSLVKETQYGGYEFRLNRNQNLTDATYFDLTLDHLVGAQEWTMRVYSADSNIIYEQTIAASAKQEWTLTTSDLDFVLVDTIQLHRKNAAYNAACPITFDFKVTVDTDSAVWFMPTV